MDPVCPGRFLAERLANEKVKSVHSLLSVQMILFWAVELFEPFKA